MNGEGVVGRRLAIWWPLDKVFYLGTVEGFTVGTGEHTIRYDDGESEVWPDTAARPVSVIAAYICLSCTHTIPYACTL